METGNSIIMRKNLDLFFRIFLFSNLGIIDRQCAICTHRPSVYFVSGFALLISFFFVTYTDRQFAICTHRPSVYFVSGFALLISFFFVTYTDRQFAICTHRPSVYFVSGFATYKKRERYSLVSKLTSCISLSFCAMAHCLSVYDFMSSRTI